MALYLLCPVTGDGKIEGEPYRPLIATLNGTDGISLRWSAANKAPTRGYCVVRVEEEGSAARSPVVYAALLTSVIAHPDVFVLMRDDERRDRKRVSDMDPTRRTRFLAWCDANGVDRPARNSETLLDETRRIARTIDPKFELREERPRTRSSR